MSTRAKIYREIDKVRKKAKKSNSGRVGRAVNRKVSGKGGRK